MKADGSDERLKMAVLYFLARVIRGRSKGGYFIEPFILQAVDDLDFVDNFPWGRYTFDDCMKEIFHLRDHFRNGIPEKAQWVFPGFINPLEVITSILEPEGEEIDLLYTIMDEWILEDVELIDDSDTADIVVDSWNQILIQPGEKIFWEDLFEMDVKTRPTEPQQEEEKVPVEPEVGGEAAGVAEGDTCRERVTELELRLNKRMDDGFALRDETIRDAGVGTPLPTDTTPEGDAGVGTPLPTDTAPEDIIGLVGEEEPEKESKIEAEKEG
ncbi:hypothetical protein N665_0100s0005 [Sinapis alba]|nr:hypothetical protein N665_0100s0005 [Sinapis alba]